MRIALSHIAIAAGLAAGLAASPALASYRSINQLTVSGGAEGFEVLTMAGRGGSDYWCAAGDFARNRLGASPSSAITVTHTAQRSATAGNRRAIGFRLGSGGGAGATTKIAVGRTMSVNAAEGQCRVSLQRLEQQSSNN